MAVLPLWVLMALLLFTIVAGPLAAPLFAHVPGLDRVIVMEKGKVVEMGRHADLMALDGTYAKLVQE